MICGQKPGRRRPSGVRRGRRPAGRAARPKPFSTRRMRTSRGARGSSRFWSRARGSSRRSRVAPTLHARVVRPVSAAGRLSDDAAARTARVVILRVAVHQDDGNVETDLDVVEETEVVWALDAQHRPVRRRRRAAVRRGVRADRLRAGEVRIPRPLDAVQPAARRGARAARRAGAAAVPAAGQVRADQHLLVGAAALGAVPYGTTWPGSTRCPPCRTR